MSDERSYPPVSPLVAGLLCRCPRCGKGKLFEGFLTLPPRCIGCGERIDAAGLACAKCWSNLNFISPPYCTCCGAPFAVTLEGEHRCAVCYAAPPASPIGCWRLPGVSRSIPRRSMSIS